MDCLDPKFREAVDLFENGYAHLALPVLLECVLSLDQLGSVPSEAYLLLIGICSACHLDFPKLSALLRSVGRAIPGKYLELAEGIRYSKGDLILKNNESPCLDPTQLKAFFDGVEENSSETSILIKLKERQILRENNKIYNKIIEEDAHLRAVPVSAQVTYKNALEGNTVTALKSISPGSIIYTEHCPIVMMINDKYKRNHCSLCCQKVGRDRVFCPKKCVDVVYCSETCRDSNQPSHAILCDTILSSSGFSGFKLDQNSQLCAQFAARFLSTGEILEDPLSFGGLPYLHYPGLDGNIYESTLENFTRLLTDFIVLRHCLDAEKRFPSSAASLDFSWFLHLQSIIQANGMTLSTAQINEFGAALYLVASMVNHSCSSNSKFKILPGAKVAIIAREALSHTTVAGSPAESSQDFTGSTPSIEQGEEISISYHPVHDMPLLLRQKYLQDTYGFLCRCSRCRRESLLASRLPASLQHEQTECRLDDMPRFFDLSTLFD